MAGASWSDAGLKTTQTVQGLDNGSTYLFEVRTVNTALPGPPAIVSATPGTGPDAPDVVATAGDGEVVLTWPTPAALGGADILRYEYRVQSAGGLFGGWASVGLATTATVRGLTNDIDYAFEVRGVNKFGVGTPGRATAKPRVAVAPAAPEVAAEAGDGNVTLSWELSDDGGAPVRRYEYRWQPESGAFGQWNSAGLDATATVSGLVNGVAYTFEVRAVNDVGAGEASAADATPARVPGAPELVARANSRAVELSWGEPGDGRLAHRRLRLPLGAGGRGTQRLGGYRSADCAHGPRAGQRHNVRLRGARDQRHGARCGRLGNRNPVAEPAGRRSRAGLALALWPRERRACGGRGGGTRRRPGAQWRVRASSRSGPTPPQERPAASHRARDAPRRAELCCRAGPCHAQHRHGE